MSNEHALERLVPPMVGREVVIGSVGLARSPDASCSPRDGAQMQMPFGAGGDSEIYCISLWQPWAQWVALGWKTVETRLHNRFASLAGKRIAIHAAQKWDKSAIDAARRYLSIEQIVRTHTFANLGGNVICTADVDYVGPCYEEDSDFALIDCGSVERTGLFFTQICSLPPIPAKGRQGMWKLLLPRGMRVELAKRDASAHEGGGQRVGKLEREGRGNERRVSGGSQRTPNESE